MKFNKRDVIWSGITMAVATGALVAGCGSGSPQLDDLNNVPPSYPNYVMTGLNVDGFPNITMVCLNGAGFATTTRDAAGAITYIPAWDAFCAKQIGKQATQNGQP